MRSLCVLWCTGLCIGFGLAVAPCAAAQMSDDMSDRFQVPGGSLFKLHVEYERFPSEFAPADHMKLPAKVDPKIVGEIHRLRMSLPNWHGTHILTPGVSASAQ